MNEAVSLQAVAFWAFLIIYGAVMLFVSPKAVTLGGFFRGEDNKGREAGPLMLTASIFISWIFAKSVTNAANLGAEYGIVGGVSYAIYWLCIPIGGLAIYRLRKKFAAKGLVPFLNENYGHAAAFCFSLAILIRLFNEVWSNSSVVGGYYGETGSKAFVIAAILFTAITLIYSMKGGLRSSIFTDAIQAVLFLILLLFLCFWIVPKHPMSDYLTSGEWKLNTGVDLVLVTVVQIFSYPFHDPVLTDRGFICEEKTMLRAFIVAGVLGFFAILLFSFIGIHARLSGMPLSGNIPADVGRTLSTGAFFLMAALMISAAGSTLDSTFSSLAKLTASDLPHMAGKDFGERARNIGMIVMIIFAIAGNAPMILGTDILKATTISGTMIIGLAPVFLLHGMVKPTKLGFHLSFFLGLILGFLYSFGTLPAWLAIGDGKNGLLLGVNLYGTIGCTLLYLLAGLWAQKKDPDWKIKLHKAA